MRTLRNAVERDKVHHAYLFVGSRGTGKTSMAKILAACLNCERGPTIEPCGTCESCVSIANASSLDVIEMDAASNNSVDDIRDLRESVAYAPVSGRRKVYILDEAHMLSTAAWNAFLKTLEEPPPNTVFVLATTEAAKVPATVVDRCHRFDFHRPTVEQIAGVVRRAADTEGIQIPPEAVAALARAATGSFRDALGTLEQLVTYSGGEIALEDVLAVLGVADARLLAEAIDAVARGDARGALTVLEECAAQGRDAALFAGDLEARLRELLVVQALGELPPQLALTPEADAALVEQAGRVPHAVVVRLLELVGEALEAVRAGADARTRLELALVKAARPEVDGSLRALLARIDRLEQGGTGGAGPAASRPPRADAATPPEQQAPPPEQQTAQPEQQAATPSPEMPAAVVAAPEGESAAASVMTDAPGPQPQARPEPDDAPDGDTHPSDAAPDPAPPTDGLDTLRSLWPAVLDLVRGENARLGAAIERSWPAAVSGEELTVAFGSSFLKKQAEGPADRMTLGEALRSVTGVRWQLSYELREAPADDAEGGASQQSEEDLVRRFMDEFDAEEVPGDWEDRDAAGREPDPRAVTSNEKGA